MVEVESWRGVPIEQMTRAELVKALNEAATIIENCNEVNRSSASLAFQRPWIAPRLPITKRKKR